MFTQPRLALAFLCALVAPLASAKPGQWAEVIDKFTRADAVHPPAQNAIVFIGSSSIVKWTSFEKDFPGVTVINRGFGGSEFTDTAFYADRIIFSYHPRIVVIYAGDNDLWAGKAPEALAAEFTAFCTKFHAALPQTRLVFIGIKPSPSRWKIRDQMVRANTLIAAECAKDKRRVFVDVFTPMLDAKGEARPELYVDDMLHMKPAGYAIWTPLVAAALK